LKALEALECDASLLALDSNQFNLFEAIGLERQELRHSNFLAFLLDPNSSHRFMGRFTEILLTEIANSPEGKKREIGALFQSNMMNIVVLKFVESGAI
jgi:hypothetical protein